MITKDKWEWMGHPGHFCGADKCRFFMTTKVGKYLISTVGEWCPQGEVEEIGWHRKYETMVFKAVKRTHKNDCCPWMQGDGSELDMFGYNSGNDARKGHMEMCVKWAKKQVSK